MSYNEWAYQQLASAFKQDDIRNFTPSEFWKPNQPPPVNLLYNIIPTVIVLQEMRDEGCGVIHITNAYRTPEHNERVGGSKNSQHLYFRATDIQTSNWSPDDVADWLELSDYTRLIGLGRYRQFTHLDTRHWFGNPQYKEPPARWDNR